MPYAYYNEHDPQAAAWIRELIKRGLIAPGEVDERDIRDVCPSDLRGFVQCHFFAGIAVWSYALRLAGWPDDEPVWTASCPCQPFSAAGKGGGFDDERHLWPDFFWLMCQSKPRSVPVFGEQVASKDGLAWLDFVQADMEGSGHAFGAVDICAAGFGAPHIRQRLYWCADAENSDGRAGVKRQQGNARGGWDRFTDHGSTILGGPDTDRARRGRRDDPIPGGAGHDQDAPLSPTGRSGVILGGNHASSARCDDARSRADLRSERSGECLPSSGCDPVLGSGDALSIRRSGDFDGDVGRQEPIEASGYALCGGSDSDGGNPGTEREQRGGEFGLLALDRRGVPAGLTAGFWGDAEWLMCRDGKYRPTQPGIFPLAHGAPERVGRLRGYGNAIVAPCAQAFIEAYREARGI